MHSATLQGLQWVKIGLRNKIMTRMGWTLEPVRSFAGGNQFPETRTVVIYRVLTLAA